jgi:hypothetical protein
MGTLFAPGTQSQHPYSAFWRRVFELDAVRAAREALDAGSSQSSTGTAGAVPPPPTRKRPGTRGGQAVPERSGNRHDNGT